MPELDDQPQSKVGEDLEARLRDLSAQIEALRRQLAAQERNLESRLVAQEHRGFAALLNFFRAFSQRAKHDAANPPGWLRRRRVSAVSGLATAFRPSPTKVLVLGGSIMTALTLVVAIAANQLVQQQNREIKVTNELAEAQRRAALMFEFTSVLEQVTDAADREPPYGSTDELTVISPLLRGRIAGLAAALRPYRYLAYEKPEPAPAWWENLWRWCGKSLWCSEKMPNWWKGPMEFISPKPTPEALIPEPLSPERGQLAMTLVRSRVAVDWGQISLRHADLQGQVLSGVDLRDADLRGASLRGANLSFSDLRGAILADADMRHATLIGANLEATDLGGADLRRATLGGADLGAADLEGADLRDAVFFGVVLSDPILGRSILSGASLAYPNRGTLLLSEAFTSEMMSNIGNPIGAELGGADLTSADLRGADMRGTNLRDADLSAADLRGAKLEQRALDLACANPDLPPKLVGLAAPLACPEPVYWEARLPFARGRRETSAGASRPID